MQKFKMMFLSFVIVLTYVVPVYAVEEAQSNPKETVAYVSNQVSGPLVLTTEQEWYAALRNALQNRQRTFEFSVSRSMEPGDVIHRFIEQNPDIAYVSSIARRGGTIEFRWKYTLEQLEEMDRATNERAIEILSKIITVRMNEKQKAKAIHDYIVSNTKYDYENYLKRTIPEDSYTAYGVLVKGVGVCQGYTAAFNQLAKMSGIQCIAVMGSAGGGGHAWTLAKLDGNVCNIDVTWDDPVPDKTGTVRYDYFGISDEKIRKDHQWSAANFGVKYLEY